MILLLKVVDTFVFVYMLMLFARIVSSWFPEFQRTQWMMFLSFCTDPYLNIFRRLIPPLGMLDLSPMVAFFALQIFQYAFKLIIVSLFR